MSRGGARSQAARAIPEALYADAPQQVSYARVLLFALGREGRLLVELNEPAQAVAVHQHQLDVARQLAARDANDRFAQIGVVIALRSVGYARARAGDSTGGLEDLRAAARAGEQVVKSDPANGFARDALAFSWRLLGEAVAIAGGTRAELCDAFRQARLHYERLLAQNALNPAGKSSLESVDRRIATCG